MLLPVAGGGALWWITLWIPSAFWLHLPSPSKSSAPWVGYDGQHCHNSWQFNIMNVCLIAFLRCVTASASMTQQLLSGRAPRLRPFRVTNADRSMKKGIMADTLEDLINKVRRGWEVFKGWHEVLWCSCGWWWSHGDINTKDKATKQGHILVCIKDSKWPWTNWLVTHSLIHHLWSLHTFQAHAGKSSQDWGVSDFNNVLTLCNGPYLNSILMSDVYVLSQVSDSLSVLCVGALLLDEDGTGVDTEEFFQTLPENTVLMVLEKGQKWSPYPVW